MALSGSDQGHNLPGEDAAAHEQLAPEASSFPVSVIGGAVAETEKDRERQAQDGERHCREGQVFAKEHAVGVDDQAGEQHGREDLGRSLRHDGTTHDEEQAPGGGALADDQGCLLSAPGMAAYNRLWLEWTRQELGDARLLPQDTLRIRAAPTRRPRRESVQPEPARPARPCPDRDPPSGWLPAFSQP